MSIVKDLLLISLFLVISFKYLKIYIEYKKQRDFFINTLNHDLRVSTIAQIRGLELLEKHCKELSQKEFIKEISESCQFTLDMVNMLLNTYKYKKGELILNYETFNINETIFRTCNSLSSLAKHKELNFDYRINNLNNVYADKNAIGKVLSTLLTTAINNSKRKSAIYIIQKKDTKKYIISIIYKGKALSNEECRRMFSQNPRFSTVGHGIKMLMCKKIIDYHKGKITVKNNGEDMNSFTFTIPYKKEKKCLTSPTISRLQLSNS